MTRILLFIYFLGLTYFSEAKNLSVEQDSILVESFQIIGNKRTKENIIFREMTFKVGDKIALEFFKSALERSSQNLTNTNLFILVKMDFEQKDGKAKVIIEVEERLYLLPLPVLYLADRSFNEWWYNHDHDLKRIVYGVQLNHYNLTGNADVLRLKAYGGFIPYFELSYSRPYIDKRQRMGLKGGVFYSQKKSFAYRTWEDQLDFVETDDKMIEEKGVYIQYNLRNAFYHFHTIYLGLTKSTIADTVKVLNPNYFGSAGNEMTYVKFRYDYRFDQRDNLQYPLKGQVFSSNLTYYGGTSLSQLNLGAAYYYFFPIHGRLYGDFNIRGKLSFPKDQLYPFVRGFGFERILVRGYDLNVIDGQHYALLQTNLKYKIFNKVFDIRKIIKFKQFRTLPVALFMKAFADMGYMQNYFPERSNSSLYGKLLLGGGLGADLVTFYDLAFNFNYSINQSGFGKVYMGIQFGL